MIRFFVGWDEPTDGDMARPPREEEGAWGLVEEELSLVDPLIPWKASDEG